MTAFSLVNPSDGFLASLVQEQEENGRLTYSEVGATLGAMPSGYRHDRWHIDLGPDENDRFVRAATALRGWAPQRGAGLRIFPDRRIEDGTTFVIVTKLARTFVIAAGRIVYAVEERDRFGFAYGTLAPHPECGEEVFTVVRDADMVRFEVRSFSRPHGVLARLGAPVTRLFQLQFARSYLDAMRHVIG
jgi:uncharacterized protein (UPF0548 family)